MLRIMSAATLLGLLLRAPSVQTGLLDALPLTAVAAFRAGLPALLDRDAPAALAALAASGAMDPTTQAGLLAALARFAANLSGPKNSAPTTPASR